MPKEHIVNKKDGLNSLWKIAKHYNVSFQELKQKNSHLKDRDPEYWINIGDKILFPEKQPANKKLGGCVGKCLQNDLIPKKIAEQKLLREFVIVVGAEDYYDRAGNKLMFMAHAIRYVRKYGKLFDLTTVFYFNKKKPHSDNQINAFKKSIRKYGGICREASSWRGIASHMNKTEYSKKSKKYIKKVQVLVFFAHGSPGKIWLENKATEFFTKSEANLIQPDTFVKDSGTKYSSIHMTSWACQTGHAGKSKLSIEKNMAQSLAQKVADILKINVYASATRTNYEKTWNSRLYEWLDSDDRAEIDGFIWEDDGADGPVSSGDTSSPSKEGTMPSGMYVFSPGQTKDYETIHLD